MTRCLLKHKHLLPPGLPPEHVAMLPTELKWPWKDHAAAHRLVDACIERNVTQLVDWKREHPTWDFGFDEYLIWCEMAARRDGEQTVLQLDTIPYGKPTSRDKVIRKVMGPIILDIFMLRYPSGDAWGEAVFSSRGSVLTRALVELRTNKPTILDHFPGRWQAIGVNSLIVRRILGPVPLSYKSSRDNSAERPKAVIVAEPAAS